MVVLKQWKTVPFHLLSVPGIVLVISTPGFAAVYLTIEQAQQAIFSGESFALIELALSEEERKAIQEKCGVPGPWKNPKVWRTSQGGYLMIDEVIGKHELITYAVGINPDGQVRQIEIMDYREAYGFEIRQKRWRRQFSGKTSSSPLQLNGDIKNISGATLSCRHITEGVKCLLSLYELILKK